METACSETAEILTCRTLSPRLIYTRNTLPPGKNNLKALED
jgi:hypothetical protein